MPVTYSKPFGTPPGIRRTSTGRWQAYSNVPRTDGPGQRFVSLGTCDTIEQAVTLRAAWVAARGAKK